MSETVSYSAGGKEAGCLTCRRISVDKVLASPISVVIVNGRNRPIDGQLLKVGASMTVQLSIKVRKDASLQKRVFSEINASHNMAGLKLYISAVSQVAAHVKHTMICSVSAK